MLSRIITRKFTNALTRLYNPLVVLKIGRQSIKTRLSHQLIEILNLYPEYNFNIARIVKYAEEHFGKVTVIDIGANIGDTVAFIRNYSDAPILCIDGEENYLKLLRENTTQYKNISICNSLVGSENKIENFKLKAEKGTAHIEESTEGVRVRTLENILEDFPAFRESKILKTDTDGFDTWILRSCADHLKKVKPVLFFEFDPHFITKNGDDPFSFIDYLRHTGYEYLMLYTNVGDFLMSCDMNNREIINQIIHHYSGRNVETFLDICAFTEEDRALYNYSVSEEIKHFKKFRNY